MTRSAATVNHAGSLMECAMSIAGKAAMLITAFCKFTWPDKGDSMASTAADFANAFDGASYGSHKYIPADEYTTQLGEPLGEGVYGYWRFSDKSLLLLTCRGPLAIVDDKGCRWFE